MGKNYLARLQWNLVCAHTIEKRFRIHTAEVILGKTGQIHNANGCANCLTFIAYHFENIVASIAVLFGTTIERKPFRALPTKSLGICASLCLEGAMQGTGSTIPCCWQFFTRHGRKIGHAVILKPLALHIVSIGENPKTTWIKARHVDFRIAVLARLSPAVTRPCSLLQQGGTRAPHP